MKRTRDWDRFPSITPAELAAMFDRTACSDRGVVVLPRDGAALCASYPNCTCGESDQRSLDERKP